ncbi:hypothetical protein D8M41_05360 [Rothia sp. HSID18069]|uniref:DUF6493 domain-containing protein n=1 Tax=Rothia aeria F0474 TaxID=1125724 RepID=I0UR39_9MICC|nr:MULTISPECIES: DUF6493 family protein [Rothia]EID50342.1 hypothetical protein HMPREF1324_1043 [Rothia aeria F0474]RUP73771.1 hypothetical protein D8M41_05360 [Rothia sp. HSID18069]
MTDPVHLPPHTSQVKSLAEMIRAILTAPETGNWQRLDEILVGTGEKERSAVLRTLGGFTAVYEREGPTPRMFYLRAALAGRKKVGEIFVWPSANDPCTSWIARHPGTNYPVYSGEQLCTDASVREAAAEAFAVGILHRGGAWVQRVMDDMLGVRNLWALHIMRLLMRDVPAERYHPNYLPTIRDYLRRPYYGEPKKREPRPERIARILTSDERLYQREFWEFFSVEGMGDTRRFAEIGSDVRGMNARKRAEACSRVEHDFTAAFDILCRQVSGFRDRLLDAALAGMLSDFSARNITWYVNIHRHLHPDSRELSRREGSYAALLAAPSAVTVSVGQNAYKSLIQSGSLETMSGLLTASEAVLSRVDKKSVTTQLSLLHALNSYAKKHGYAEVPEKVSTLVAGHLPTFPVDLAEKAQKLITLEGTQGAGITGAIKTDADSLEVPAPRATPILHYYAQKVSVPCVTELNELIAEHLIDAGNGADLPRIIDGVITHGIGAVDAQNFDRIRQLARQEYVGSYRERNDRTDEGAEAHLWDNIPYSSLMALAFAKIAGLPKPAGAAWDRLIAHMTVGGDTGLFLPNRALSTVLIHELNRFVECIIAGEEGAPLMVAVPPQQRSWERRRYRIPSLGYGRDENREAAWWFAPVPQAYRKDPAVSALLAGTADRIDGNFGIHDAMVFNGRQRVREWAGWMLQHNNDTYAAHAHMELAHGMQPVLFLRSLEHTGRVLQEPVYSALAHACGAAQAEGRAAAAEALAGLCASNLFDPQFLAKELILLFDEKAIIASRIAKTLDDTAQLSALAGYRVLQTLAAVVTGETTIPRGHQLTVLLAQLCVQYGVSVPIPDRLIPAPKARGTAAAALRTILTLEPHPTELLAEAAQQAEAANKL